MTPPLLAAARTARAVSVDVLSGGGDVIVLAPHPDDETLGCGGAIAALTDLGRRVQVIVVTDGGHSHPGSTTYPRDRVCRTRADEVQKAVAVLTGGRGPAPVLLGYPDNAAPDGAVASAAADLIQTHIGAQTALWTTWAGDPHPDHGRTARIAAILAARHPQLALWAYPIWGRFAAQLPDFNPDLLVQFETHAWQARKATALAAHASQMTGLIGDDPNGFYMEPAMQQHFVTSAELFLRVGS